MDYKTFLQAVIELGISGVKASYSEETSKDRYDGGIAGFNACRDKSQEELLQLFKDSHSTMMEYFGEDVNKYWYYASFWSEVEWTLNCLSAYNLITYTGKELCAHLPTVRGYSMAESILRQNQTN